jgi:hypothetical protein
MTRYKHRLDTMDGPIEWEDDIPRHFQSISLDLRAACIFFPGHVYSIHVPSSLVEFMGQ